MTMVVRTGVMVLGADQGQSRVRVMQGHRPAVDALEG
jgi:hypothetical protein